MFWIKVGSVLMFLAVCLGAFGGHVLKKTLTPDLFDVFEVGVRYHIYHALAIGLVGVLSLQRSSPWIARSGWSFLIGVVVFSGSLMILSLSGVRMWGAVTPIGGVLFLVGWVCLFLSCTR